MGVKNKIKELRKQHHITQVEMAKVMQVTRQTIVAIENHHYNESRAILKNRQIFWDEGGGNLYAGVKG